MCSFYVFKMLVLSRGCYGTIRNLVGFLTQIKILGSGNTSFFLYLPESLRQRLWQCSVPHICVNSYFLSWNQQNLKQKNWLINICNLSSNSATHRNFNHTYKKLSPKRNLKPRAKTLKVWILVDELSLPLISLSRKLRSK